MALNPAAMAAIIEPALKAAHIAVGAAPNPALDTFIAACSLAIATGVCTHIAANGTVAVVTACGAGAGTGTGVIT